MARELLNDKFQYILTFKFSQDHIETLFSKIRSMGGFNNNPTVVQFKSAVRKLQAKQAVSSSTSSNSLDSGSSSGVFSLEWSKRSSPINPPSSIELSDHLLEQLESLPNSSLFADNILYYISGYISKSMLGRMNCSVCAESLVHHQPIAHSEHSYYQYEGHEQLTAIKNRGGLVIPSAAVYSVVRRTESIVQQFVITNSTLMHHRQLRNTLLLLFNRDTLEDRPCVFFTNQCPVVLGELPHSQQLCNAVVSKFLDIRLKHFSRVFNRAVVFRNKASDRNRLNRLVIFKHQ